MADVSEPKAGPALSTLYAPIRPELDQVEALLREQLTSVYPFVDRLAKHSFRLGGKRMRPALVLLSARASGECRPEHLSLAAMVELVHTATLIHDDVLDEAKLRRHVETVNSTHDNETSVLLGDYLFARSLCLVATVDDPFATRTIGEASRLMCEGELRQVASRGNFALTEDEYFSIIADKTAALTECCCRLGAHYAGANYEAVAALAQYGHALGVAFQIADDLLDLLGDEAKAGKSLGTDLVKQKLTLPLIRVLDQANQSERTTMIAAMRASDTHHRETLRPWLERSDAVDYARGRGEEHIRRAIAALDVLPPSPARDALAGLAEFSLSRQM